MEESGMMGWRGMALMMAVLIKGAVEMMMVGYRDVEQMCDR